MLPGRNPLTPAYRGMGNEKRKGGEGIKGFPLKQRARRERIGRGARGRGCCCTVLVG